jgi:hypothetical protein
MHGSRVRCAMYTAEAVSRKQTKFGRAVREYSMGKAHLRPHAYRTILRHKSSTTFQKVRSLPAKEETTEATRTCRPLVFLERLLSAYSTDGPLQCWCAQGAPLPPKAVAEGRKAH